MNYSKKRILLVLNEKMQSWGVVFVIEHWISILNAQEDTGVHFHRNFNSILRGIIKKISYDRLAYESVDEKSLS